MKKTILIAGLLIAGQALAGEYDAVVERAINAISDDYYREWAFTESILEDDVLFTGRYDPRLPEGSRWTLLSVDGRGPTDEELADYLDDKADEYQWNNDGDDRDRDTDMVDFHTLELLEETDEYWIFSFVPSGDDMDGDEEQTFMEQVTATMKIVRDGPYLEYIDLRNEKAIRPAFGVRISDFRVHMTFGPAANGGPIVQKSEDVAIKGRALLLVTFNETESTRYSDFEYAGD